MSQLNEIETMKQIIGLQEQIIQLYEDEYSNCREDPDFLRVREILYEKIRKLEISLK